MHESYPSDSDCESGVNGEVLTAWNERVAESETESA